MKLLNSMAVLIFVLLLSACGDNSGADNAQADISSDKQVAQYTCPMHPHYISTDADGSCPICGMDLVAASVDSSTSMNDKGVDQQDLSMSDNAQKSEAMSKQHSSEQIAQYTCPMHPHYISTDADGSCPICGMDLVAVNAGNHDSDSPVEQESAITVPTSMLQTMGVRTSPVETVELAQTLRAFGTVEADQRLENVSVSRLEGWIDNLTVSAEGDEVKSGDLMYRVYSPDLISAQRDYISALKTGNANRVESVKQRLISVGMQTQTLQQLTQDKSVIENVPVYAETNGVVAELNVRNGDYIKPGDQVLRLQSYSKVWVMASIPETDLPLINRGISASLQFPSAPNAQSKGTIDYIYPTIDPSTRTAKVRIELDNANGYLQPGAYVDITLDFDKQARLSIVSEAILRDSRGYHVIVALGSGRFSSRSVRTGITTQGRTEIIEGLDVGDIVVASGQFMLDSEVNLREGLSKLSIQVEEAPPAVKMESMQKNDDLETALSDIKLDSGSLGQIDHLVDMALYFHTALIKNEAIEPSFVDPGIALADLLATQYKETKLKTILQQSKVALVNAQKSVSNQALATALDDLMQAIKPWLLQGVPQHYADLGLTLHKDQSTDQLWIQIDSEIKNPYGDGESELIVWPESMKMPPVVASDKEAVMPDMQVDDPHANHQ